MLYPIYGEIFLFANHILGARRWGVDAYPRDRTCWRWSEETEHQPEAACILGRERFSSLRTASKGDLLHKIHFSSAGSFPPLAYAYIISLARLFRSRQYDSGCIMYSWYVTLAFPSHGFSLK